MDKHKSIHELSVEELKQALQQERARSAELDKLLDLKIQEMCVLNSELSAMNSNLEEAVSSRTQELQKTVLKLQQLAKSKSQFVANMSHELRTPLNGVIGFAKILIENLKSHQLTEAEQLSYSEQIEHAGKRLLTHVERILDFSQLEEKQFVSKSEEFHLDNVLTEIYSQFKIMADKKALQFHLSVAESTPQMWSGDQRSFFKIADVVIENAIKYTETGHVRIEISHEKHPIANSNVLVMKVKDSGPGMTEDQLTQVFAPFSQSDNSDQRKHGGLGLGLTMASRLAQTIGAEIRANSSAGSGSEFVIWYPETSIQPRNVEAEVLAKTAEAEDPITSVKNISAKIRLLAVDDDESNLLLIRANLKKLGINCLTANNGQDCLDKVGADKSINIILMDCQMPVMNGVDASRELRNRGNKAAVIAVTANATQTNKDQCVEAGMNGFISKPYSIEQLANAILDSWWFLEAGLEPSDVA